jgi:hypothetical protein
MALIFSFSMARFLVISMPMNSTPMTLPLPSLIGSYWVMYCLPNKRGQADVAVTGAQQRVARVRVVELGADGAFAVFFQRGGDAHELVAVGGKDGGDDAGFAVNLSGMLKSRLSGLPCLRGGRLAADVDGGAASSATAAAELAANRRAKLDASFIMAVLNTSTGIADAAQRVGDVGLGALSAWPRCSC